MLNRSSLLLISLVLGSAGASHAVNAVHASSLEEPRKKALPSKNSAPASKEQVKEAVKAHRAEEREQILRDEALVGRRLTPAERAEMREQLRREWDQRASTTTADGAQSGSVQNSGWSWRSIFPWLRNP